MAIVRFVKIAELMGNTQANESTFRRFRDYAANVVTTCCRRGKKFSNYNLRQWTACFFFHVPLIIDNRIVVFNRSHERAIYLRQISKMPRATREMKISKMARVQIFPPGAAGRCSAMLTMLHAATGFRSNVGYSRINRRLKPDCSGINDIVRRIITIIARL